MELKFRIESLQDAVLASAAVQAVQSVFARTSMATGTLAVGAEELSPALFGTQFVDKLDGDQSYKVTVEETTALDNAVAATDQVITHLKDAAKEDKINSEPEYDRTPYTKEQLKAAAAHNEELAALVSKRGKKTPAHWARLNQLAAEVIGDAAKQQPVGTALKGQTAQQLQAALTANTVPANSPEDAGKQPILETNTQVVHQEPGLEVRAQPGPEADSFQAALAERFKNDPKTEPSASAQQEQADPLEGMSREELYQRIRKYAEDGAGLFWMRNVVDAGGGDASKMSAAHMITALRNPTRYFPNAA